MSQVVSLLDRVVLSVPEAARQLRIPQSTLRHWLEGHTVRGKWYEPVLRPTPEGHNQVTWGEMVEASYLRRYREHRVPMQQLRSFIERAREVFDSLSARPPCPVRRWWPHSYIEHVEFGEVSAALNHELAQTA